MNAISSSTVIMPAARARGFAETLKTMARYQEPVKAISANRRNR
jgi:hypothetical protein